MALGAEEATVQLPWVDVYPGSSDTCRLHHAVEVQPWRDQSHRPEVHQWGRWCHVCPEPQDRPLGSVSKKGSWRWVWEVQWNCHSEQTDPDWGSTTTSALIIKALKEPPGDRKKQKKKIKHSGNITCDEIVKTARQMRYQSLARELSGTLKRSWALPSLWAAKLMAATLMTSQVTSTVVQ